MWTGKLVTSAIFVLIDGPHQAGIALLNEIQEAQAPIAILFRDRHDEPQIATGQLPLHPFVGNKLLPKHVATVSQTCGTFERMQHKLLQFGP